jgi:hypothetical protein
VPPLAANCTLYAVPPVAAGRGDAVLIARLLTLIDKDAEAEALFESVTLIVKLNVPCAVGVPEMSTELVVLVPRDNPAGRLPDAIDHVNGAAPPVASTVALYAALVLPEARVVVVTVSTSGFELTGVPEQPATATRHTAKRLIRRKRGRLTIEITLSI